MLGFSPFFSRVQTPLGPLKKSQIVRMGAKFWGSPTWSLVCLQRWRCPPQCRRPHAWRTPPTLPVGSPYIHTIHIYLYIQYITHTYMWKVAYNLTVSFDIENMYAFQLESFTHIYSTMAISYLRKVYEFHLVVDNVRPIKCFWQPQFPLKKSLSTKLNSKHFSSVLFSILSIIS